MLWVATRFPLSMRLPHAFLAVMKWLDEISLFLASEFFFLMLWCKDGGEVDVERCGEIEWTRWFIARCVELCASWVGRWRGVNVSCVVLAKARVSWET